MSKLSSSYETKIGTFHRATNRKLLSSIGIEPTTFGFGGRRNVELGKNVTEKRLFKN